MPSLAEVNAPNAATICSSVGGIAFGAAIQGGAHVNQMFGHGTATAADDRRAAVARHFGIISHQFGRAIIVDVPFDIFWDAGIALCNDRQWHPLGGKAENRAQDVGRAGAAVGTIGQRHVVKRMNHVDHRFGCHAHHGASGGVKAHRADPIKTRQFEPFGSGAVFFGGADGFQPAHIGPTSL